ncbi:MAG: SurA N-terminal domain-containing protein [Sphingomonadaceae bacterium]
MLKFFRKIFSNKLGLLLTFALLAIIALAFAVGDVAGNGSLSSLSNGTNVAVVGKSKVPEQDLSRAATNALDRARQQNPTLSMPGFIAQGGLQQVLDQLVSRQAINDFAQKFGLRAGPNLVNSEIQKIPAFRGTDGNFSETNYKAALTAQNLTDAMVRDDIQSGLLAQQLLAPVGMGMTMPKQIATHYALLFKERRVGAIGALPSAAFAPKDAPDDKILTAYYNANKDKFIRPERRIVRYALFDESAVAPESITPTEAEIRQRYDRDKSKYSASVKLSAEQLIVPTQQAAEAIRKSVAAGGSLEQAAANAGLKTSKVGPVDKQQLAQSASQAVADAYFSAKQGELTQPAQSPLGWQIAKITNITRQPARSLAEVTPDIRKTLESEKRTKALSNMASHVEDELDGGATLSDVAKELKLTIQKTQPITANGVVYGTNQPVSPELMPVIKTAFEMDESAPQVADAGQGKQFIVYDVSNITPSAPAPMKDIHKDVVDSWRLAQGDKAASAAADRILGRVAKGSTLAAAIAAEKTPLPPVQTVSLTREDLAKQQGRVPPPIALMFSMAQGTSKRLEIGDDRGYFLVDLSKIELGKITADDPLVAQAQTELGKTLANEQSDEFIAAIRKDVGVKTNPAAIEAVRKQLTGER